MKRALVTGASGGIGAAIARRLVADGLQVILHANKNIQAVEALAAEIRKAGKTVETVAFNVAEVDTTRQALERLLARGPVQVLVNNAGMHDDAPLAGMRPEQWRTVIEVNLQGFYNVTQPLLLPMMRTRWGRIISISSVAALLGNRGQANYAAAKAGLHGASKSLAHEVGTRGITVNVVAPGIIQTPMTEALFTPEQIAQLVPLKRAGTPEEVADLVGFLASERAAYISGQIVSINGGMV